MTAHDDGEDSNDGEHHPVHEDDDDDDDDLEFVYLYENGLWGHHDEADVTTAFASYQAVRAALKTRRSEVSRRASTTGRTSRTDLQR